MSNNIELCKESNCMDMQTTGDYCRLHYIKNWKKIKTAESKTFNMNMEDYISKILVKKAKKAHVEPKKTSEKKGKEEWQALKPNVLQEKEEEFKDLDEIFIDDDDLDEILDELTYIGQ